MKKKEKKRLEQESRRLDHYLERASKRYEEMSEIEHFNDLWRAGNASMEYD